MADVNDPPAFLRNVFGIDFLCQQPDRYTSTPPAELTLCRGWGRRISVGDEELLNGRGRQVIFDIWNRR